MSEVRLGPCAETRRPRHCGAPPEEMPPDFPIAATAQSRLRILDMSQASPRGKVTPPPKRCPEKRWRRGATHPISQSQVRRGATRFPNRRDGPDSPPNLGHGSGLSSGEDRALFEGRRELGEPRTRLSLRATPVEGRERALLRSLRPRRQRQCFRFGVRNRAPARRLSRSERRPGREARAETRLRGRRPFSRRRGGAARRAGRPHERRSRPCAALVGPRVPRHGRAVREPS